MPLTLARMPGRHAQYGVFEIGMNHAGEIAPLAAMVTPARSPHHQPVEPVHLGHFHSVAEIAEAKAEILNGLVPGGTAVLPRDNAHFPLLRERAASVGARLVTFGYHDDADFRCAAGRSGPQGILRRSPGMARSAFPITVGAPGEHYVQQFAGGACHA